MIASKTLFYGMLFLGIASLVFNIGTPSTQVVVFTAFIASWVLSLILKKRGVHTYKYELLINIAIWINIFGQYGFYYTNFPYYDKFLHFFTGILITSIICKYYEKDQKVDRNIIFFITLGMLAAWEIYEYVLFAYLNVPAMGVIQNGIQTMSPLDDTMLDLICGSIGAVLYFMFYSFFKNKRKI
jgi:uncharacterized membrane protein YjdF